MPLLRNLPKRRFRNRHRMPRQQEARGIQLSYYTALKSIVNYCADLVKERLISRLPDLLVKVHPEIKEDAADPAGRVTRIMRALVENAAKQFSQERLVKIAERIARTTSEHQKTQLFKQVKAGIGVELGTIADRGLTARIRHFTAENVALIQSIPRDYFTKVEKTVLAGMRDGSRHETLAEEIAEETGVAASRAKLIARDQVNKFFGDLNHARQEQLGIEQYFWRTVGDERVRDAHDELAGGPYSWDDPPGDPSDPAVGGHPGEAIQCRCYAEPYLDPILEDLEGSGIDENSGEMQE